VVREEASGVPLAARAARATKVKAEATVASVKTTAASSSRAAAAASGKSSRQPPFTTYGDVCYNIVRCVWLWG
jgi:hypothetical protein